MVFTVGFCVVGKDSFPIGIDSSSGYPYPAKHPASMKFWDMNERDKAEKFIAHFPKEGYKLYKFTILIEEEG